MPFDFEKWLIGPLPNPTRFQCDPRYDSLPEAIKANYTAEQYSWLGNDDKARIIERHTMPDPEEFGV